ncbi:MAG: enoyl-CoA hydratase/isomerase family protein [Thermoleophilia bacterium]|nr:enoyl-CoA hydratase/isomerase family protein [Thermoleophilia bacterium]
MGIRVEREGTVAVVVLDRPDALNALDLEHLGELRDRLRELSGDAGSRVVVLTGAGERAFAAGADIGYMSGLSVLEAREWGGLGQETAHLLETMAKPTIAAVNGFALGGGCELALACDLRYASRRAKLGQPEVNLGVIPGWGGTQRLARTTTLGFAKELVLTGRVVDAEEAERRGLVNAVYEPDELMPRTLETARLLAAKGAVALAWAKEAVNLSLQGAHDANLVQEENLFALGFATEDQDEGMAAFLEKREARFRGR